LEIQGLTSAEVRERIAQGLQNKSAEARTKTINTIIIENIFSVFNIIIFSIIIFLLVFYVTSGDRRLLFDSIGTSMVAILNTLIAVIQEIRSKRALDKVNLLLKKEVTVVRDGVLATINPVEIVRDDVLVIERGDQVVVDGKILKANHLEIDESLLTGESEPIEKSQNDTVLSGSFCVSGNGYYTAEKVGAESYANDITKLAKRYKMNVSPLQSKLNYIVKMLFGIAVFLAALEIVRNPGGFSDMDFVRRISTILLALVPQGLVLMASVTFALGIYRISKIGAIIQKLNAIESFANVKVVCTDKTGTLTQNKLAVKKITMLNDSYDMERVEKLLGTYAKLSSDKNATLRTLEPYTPMENAEAIDEIPFSSEYKRSFLQLTVNSEQLAVNSEQLAVNSEQLAMSNKEMTLVLGGFDVLIEKSLQKDKAQNSYEDAGLKVYRNVLFGKVKNKSLAEIRKNMDDVEIEPICIVSITDQVRNDVMEAINLFLKNDIEVKILSGDAAASVQAVAKEIGWDIKDDELITGSELEEIKDEQLASIIMQKKIFARLKPDHKLRIIKALKSEKIYTAMIGDGVNDLPAIKESDMGIAMEDGSKITKEVADIVLLKNKFSLLPAIFDEGNKIVNTVNSVAKLFLTKNAMVIYLTLLSLFFSLHFPLTPRRVSLINIFAIGLPSMIIALRNSNVKKALNFSKDLFSFVTISALIIVGAAYLGFHLTRRAELHTEEDIQMVMLSIMIFITVANFLTVTLRADEKNNVLYIIYAVGLVLLYYFFAEARINWTVFHDIKRFYEIYYLKPQNWDTVLLVSTGSAAVLIAAQAVRRYLIFGKN